MRNTILTLLLFSIFQQNSSAQGIAPAQFFSAPLTLNPAFTGLINSDVRVATDYYFHRGPYPASPVRRNDVSIDMPILKGLLPKGDALGIGLLYQYF